MGFGLKFKLKTTFHLESFFDYYNFQAPLPLLSNLPLRSIASLRSALSLLRGQFNSNANGHRNVHQHSQSGGLRSSLRLFFGRDRAPYWLTSDDKPKYNDSSARLSRFAFHFSFGRKDSARVENREGSIPYITQTTARAKLWQSE